jgi:hypothetical protein
MSISAYKIKVILEVFMIETNNIRTKGMDAVDAVVSGNSVMEGTLLAGDAWDKDGVENPNSAGGILFRKTSKAWDGSDSGVNLKNATLFGDTVIGFTRDGISINEFYGRRKIMDNAAQLLWHQRMIKGSYTAAQLYDILLPNLDAAWADRNGFFVPINGTVYYYRRSTGPGDPGVDLLCQIHSLQVLGYSREMRGMDKNGDNIRCEISSTQFVIKDDDTASTIDTISGNTKIKVNFVFL